MPKTGSPKPRRVLGLLLLAILALQGCYRTVELAEVDADQSVSAVRLRSGEVVRFVGAERARWTGETVAVHRRRSEDVLREIPGADVESYYVEQLQVVRTSLLAGALALVIVLMVTTTGGDGGDGFGGYACCGG